VLENTGQITVCGATRSDDGFRWTRR